MKNRPNTNQFLLPEVSAPIILSLGFQLETTMYFYVHRLSYFTIYLPNLSPQFISSHMASHGKASVEMATKYFCSVP